MRSRRRSNERRNEKRVAVGEIWGAAGPSQGARPLWGETREARFGGGFMTGTLLTAFLALMVTGIPVAIAMAGASLIYIWVSGNSPPMVVVHRMISGLDSFP